MKDLRKVVKDIVITMKESNPEMNKIAFVLEIFIKIDHFVKQKELLINSVVGVFMVEAFLMLLGHFAIMVIAAVVRAVSIIKAGNTTVDGCKMENI